MGFLTGRREEDSFIKTVGARAVEGEQYREMKEIKYTVSSPPLLSGNKEEGAFNPRLMSSRPY